MKVSRNQRLNLQRTSIENTDIGRAFSIIHPLNIDHSTNGNSPTEQSAQIKSLSTQEHHLLTAPYSRLQLIAEFAILGAKRSLYQNTNHAAIDNSSVGSRCHQYPSSSLETNLWSGRNRMSHSIQLDPNSDPAERRNRQGSNALLPIDNNWVPLVERCAKSIQR